MSISASSRPLRALFFFQAEDRIRGATVNGVQTCALPIFEGVDMITELTTSSVALAIHELSKQMKKIDIVVGAATSRLTGDACQPYGFHWAYDTHALAVGTGGALV